MEPVTFGTPRFDENHPHGCYCRDCAYVRKVEEKQLRENEPTPEVHWSKRQTPGIVFYTPYDVFF